MIKRLFMMKHLNISQGRYGGYSHKTNNAYDLVGKDRGIDDFIATCTLEVIGVYKFNYVTRQGFANTVHLYDRENNITLALTHMNSLPHYIGQVFKPGDVCYSEGTAGRATGNHIHFEIGKGWQPKKIIKDNEYKLANQINIEDYFYIDGSIKLMNTLYNFEYASNEFEIVNPSLTLYIFDTVEVYDRPNKTIVGKVFSGEYAIIKGITNVTIGGYKYCLVDTYRNQGVYVRVDFSKMRFEI